MKPKNTANIVKEQLYQDVLKRGFLDLSDENGPELFRKYIAHTNQRYLKSVDDMWHWLRTEDFKRRDDSNDSEGVDTISTSTILKYGFESALRDGLVVKEPITTLAILSQLGFRDVFLDTRILNLANKFYDFFSKANGSKSIISRDAFHIVICSDLLKALLDRLAISEEVNRTPTPSKSLRSEFYPRTALSASGMVQFSFKFSSPVIQALVGANSNQNKKEFFLNAHILKQYSVLIDLPGRQ